MASPLSLDLDHLPALITAAGAVFSNPPPRIAAASVVLPGSFHPVHDGHWELAAVARRLLGQTVAFELSVANVDKPELTCAEVIRRVSQFANRADVWVTRAPRFTEKAALFPGTTFVVGADTALRLVQTRYYGGDTSDMLAALATLRQSGCRFLVAPRVAANGKLQTLTELPIPHDHADLFLPIAADCFRCDLSSTQLRREGLTKGDVAGI